MGTTSGVNNDRSTGNMTINSKRVAVDCHTLGYFHKVAEQWPDTVYGVFGVLFTAENCIDGVTARKHIAVQTFALSVSQEQPDDCL